MSKMRLFVCLSVCLLVCLSACLLVGSAVAEQLPPDGAETVWRESAKSGVVTATCGGTGDNDTVSAVLEVIVGYNSRDDDEHWALLSDPLWTYMGEDRFSQHFELRITVNGFPRSAGHDGTGGGCNEGWFEVQLYRWYDEFDHPHFYAERSDQIDRQRGCNQHNR